MNLMSKEQLLNAPEPTHHTRYWSGIIDPKIPIENTIRPVLDIGRNGQPHESQYGVFKWFNDARSVLDVGANCGQSIVSFRAVGVTAPIKSFEPNPLAFEVARKVATIFTDCEVFNFGLSDETASLPIFTPVIDGLLISPLTSLDQKSFEPGGAMYEFVTKDIAKGAEVAVFRQEIELKRGDDLDLAPDIIKIDVEGAELPVIKGFTRTLAEHKPALMIEKSDAAEVAQVLAEIGYHPYWYEGGNPALERTLRRIRIDATSNNAVIPVNIIYISDEKIGYCQDGYGISIFDKLSNLTKE